jgi:hypothetical protein
VPYTAANLEALLVENTRRALLTPLHLEIEGDQARLSRLFDWYESDFERAAGSVEAFIREHLSPTRAGLLANTERRSFIDYDWQLNSPEPIREWLDGVR